MVRKSGRNFESVQLGTLICTLVVREKKRVAQLWIATNRGWPIRSINFKAIPGRIVKLREQLHPIVHNKSFREEQHIWRSFLDNLAADGRTLPVFANAQNKTLYGGLTAVDRARPG